MKQKILLVDNVLDFLVIQARLLEGDGYRVVKASTVTEAERYLDDDWFHLAIIDQRMEDEEDPNDISGLVLANKERFRNVKKIILTAYPDYESAVFALRPSKGHSSADEYVSKSKGHKELSEKITQVFADLVLINWNLIVEWIARDPYSLAMLIEPGLKSDLVTSRAEELEDLFRRLFFEKNNLRVEHLLWVHNNRIALVVLAFSKGNKPESFVMVCGQNSAINQEASRFTQYAPKAPAETGTLLGEKMKAETAHFAANAYSLVGNDLEHPMTLLDLYRANHVEAFNAAVNHLFHVALKAWHTDVPIPGKDQALGDLYRQRLGLEHFFTEQHFEKRLASIQAQIPSLGLTLERDEQTLSIHFDQISSTCPNPLPLLPRSFKGIQPVLLTTVPGELSGNGILTDDAGRTWLTDFLEAGLAPLFWNYISLEAAIRYDWIETKDLQQYYELENHLISASFAKPIGKNFKQEGKQLADGVQHAAYAITAIRKLAAPTVGKDTLLYHVGMFFQAAHRLADFNPERPLKTNELARLGHILMSISLLARIIEPGDPGDPGGSSSYSIGLPGISIIEVEARRIGIGNREAVLRPQEFALFSYLYNHANQVCAKEELLEKALKGEYVESYVATLVSRIRQVIEEDPRRPRYLLTVPSTGYRLILKPE